MAKTDYYDLLGVSRDASDKELKSAFRKKAMEWHPDRNDAPEAETRFKEYNEAYEILKDPQKRKAYDQFGHAAFEGGGGAGAGGFGGGFGGGQGFDSFSDIFEDMFGGFTGRGRGGQRQSGRGADLQYNLDITLEEAFEGKAASIRVPGSVSCESCNGSGARAGSRPVTCNTCHGRGKVRAQQGFFTVERACPTCGGRGETIADPCGVCQGQGRIQKERTLSVNIPAGVDDGTRIRLSGEGEAGLRGAPAGDLYIFLNIRSHELFQRDGENLLIEVPVSMTTAAIGGHVDVPSINGSRVRVTVPAGTQSGKRLRLRGKGMSIYQRSSFGDLYVDLVVETPTNLTRRQKELMEEFQREEAQNSPRAAGFFDKARQFFTGE